MNLLLSFLTSLLLSLLLSPTLANVEKTIFLAPSPDTYAYTSSSPAKIDPPLDDLGLETLSPEDPLVRTRLNASFPAISDSGSGDGEESWFLLQALAPGVRYEERRKLIKDVVVVKQPTSFTLTTHTLPEIIHDPALLAAVSRYSNTRLEQQQPGGTQRQSRTAKGSKESILFLRIHAAADYFTLHDPLMRAVPPVFSDIILDPYLGNIFPRSLVPTACWGLVVGVVAVAVARWVLREFGRVILGGLRDVPTADASTVEGKKGR